MDVYTSYIIIITAQKIILKGTDLLILVVFGTQQCVFIQCTHLRGRELVRRWTWTLLNWMLDGMNAAEKEITFCDCLVIKNTVMCGVRNTEAAIFLYLHDMIVWSDLITLLDSWFILQLVERERAQTYSTLNSHFTLRN